MPFSDIPTSALWIGGLKGNCTAQDLSATFSSFGLVKAIRLGPVTAASAGTGGEQEAEVYFHSVAAAAAALTALNAIVVPRLSGGRPLAIQCWQQGQASPAVKVSAAAPTAHASAAAAGPKPVALAKPAPMQLPVQHSAAQQAVQGADAGSPAGPVELPGVDDLDAAAQFLQSCCYSAIPDEERWSAAKWALLQALLARGLKHEGGCSFCQVLVHLSHVGDELLKHRASNPAVEAEYQAAGKLTTLAQDGSCRQLIEAQGVAHTRYIQLNLPRLAAAGGSSSLGADAGGMPVPAAPQMPAAAKPAAAAATKGPPPPSYIRSSKPSRHMVLLGVVSREDVPALCQLARQHGNVQAHMHNLRKAELTLHFDTVDQAVSLAREVEEQVVPGLSSGTGPIQIEYKHEATTAAAPAPVPQKQPPKQQAMAAGVAAGAAAAGSEGQHQQQYRYSSTEPSCMLRVKRLQDTGVDRESLKSFGSRFGELQHCVYYPTSGIGYLAYSSEHAAVAAAAALRAEGVPPAAGAVPGKPQGKQELQVEFRVPAGGTGSTQAQAPAQQQQLQQLQQQQQQNGGSEGPAPPCCARCAASGDGVTLRLCSGCRALWYCGRECQVEDWAQHSSECQQLQVLAGLLRQQEQQAGEASAAPGAGLGSGGMQLLAAALRQPGSRQAQMLQLLLEAAGIGGQAAGSADRPIANGRATAAVDDSGVGSSAAAAAAAQKEAGVAEAGGSGTGEGPASEAAAAAAAGGAAGSSDIMSSASAEGEAAAVHAATADTISGDGEGEGDSDSEGHEAANGGSLALASHPGLETGGEGATLPAASDARGSHGQEAAAGGEGGGGAGGGEAEEEEEVAAAGSAAADEGATCAARDISGSSTDDGRSGAGNATGAGDEPGASVADDMAASSGAGTGDELAPAT